MVLLIYSLLNFVQASSFLGNFHALLMFKTDEELDTVREAVHRMVHRAIALDGTCK